MPHTDHIRCWYEGMTSVYTDAAAFGVACAAIADYYLERWWCVWSALCVVETFPVAQVDAE